MNFTKNIQWKLPINFQGEISKKISWDAQVYLKCPNCGFEYRLDGTFSSMADDPHGYPCKSCDSKGLVLIRHLESYSCKCYECQTIAEGQTHGFEELNCSHCGSENLEIKKGPISPPFPIVFGELLTHKDPHWGISCKEDMKSILEEFKYSGMMAEQSRHAQIYSRFCKRLRLYCEYPAPDQMLIRNVESQILKVYFRASGDLAAGLECLRLSEECAKESPEGINKALMEHNVAMEIYSILVLFPEKLINVWMSPRAIRQEGIRAAERALEGVKAHLPNSNPQRNSQIARILHVLGDLLKVGEASPQELRRAVDTFSKALAIPGLNMRLQATISESRALATTLMANLTPDEIKQAIQDYELSGKRDEHDRRSSEKWTALANLGSLYLSNNDLPKATSNYELAAAMVLHNVSRLVDQAELLHKGKTYVKVIEGLARTYVQSGKYEKALDVIETLRAATLRIHTMPEKELQQQKKKMGSNIAQDFMGSLFGKAPSHTNISRLKLESSKKKLNHFWRTTKNIPTCLISYSIDKEVVSCIIAFRNGKIKGKYWKVEDGIIDVLLKCAKIDSLPLRSQFLEGSRNILYEAFFAPILPLISGNRFEQIGISAPGPLSHLPFDCFGSSEFLIDFYDIFQIPSLTIVSDLSKLTPLTNRDHRLLIIGYGGKDLPFTQKEIQSLRESWKGAVDYIPPNEASKAYILEALEGNYSFIHFTCHGSFDIINPLESALLLSGHDHPKMRITAREISKIQFSQHPIISLSACSSALTSYGQANDWIGLPGSLFQAGAKGIIGTKWSVYDDTAAKLITDFYQRLRLNPSFPLKCLSETKRSLSKLVRLDDWAAFGYLGT